VDTVAPAALPAPNLTPLSDTGESSTDNVTNDNTPSFVGPSEIDALVRLLEGATVRGSDATTSSGSIRSIRAARLRSTAGASVVPTWRSERCRSRVG
jgi:hypothetical protein